MTDPDDLTSVRGAAVWVGVPGRRRMATADVRWSCRVRVLAIVALFVLLALWATWPLALSPAAQLPTGSSEWATVPLFNVWTIWWNADRLLHGFGGYWDAPIFHPAGRTFAFSEPQPATLLVAPLLWLTGSRILAYNVYLWLSLVLNGVFAWRLLRVVGINHAAAAAGGSAMILLPIVHWQLGVLQLVPLWGVLWTWTAFFQFSRRPTVLRGGELGAAWSAAFLICAHQGLFLAVLLIGAAAALWERLLQRRTWSSAMAAAAVAVVLTSPFIIQFQSVANTYRFQRSDAIVARLSALPGDYTAAFGKQWVDCGDLAARPHWRLSPGWVKLGLAAVGAVLGLYRRKWRRWSAFLLLTAGLAFLLSLGPNLRIGAWQPWWTLTQICPGFSQVRNVFRFAYFVQMAAVLFAAQGLCSLHLLSRCCRPIQRRSACRFASGVVVFALGLAIIFEVRPERPQFANAPDAAAHLGWIQFVRDETPSDRAIACLPFAPGNRTADFELTTHWMYLGTYHGVPLVNGYSGFFPPDSFKIRNAVNTAFPSEEALRLLWDAGVEFLVVNQARCSEQPLAEGESNFETMSLERIRRDPAGIDVYRIVKND